MIANLHAHIGPAGPSKLVSKVLAACVVLAEKYNVEDMRDAKQYLLHTKAGHYELINYFFDTYDLEVKQWQWVDGTKTIAYGLDFRETSAFTMFMLDDKPYVD